MSGPAWRAMNAGCNREGPLQAKARPEDDADWFRRAPALAGRCRTEREGSVRFQPHFGLRKQRNRLDPTQRLRLPARSPPPTISSAPSIWHEEGAERLGSLGVVHGAGASWSHIAVPSAGLTCASRKEASAGRVGGGGDGDAPPAPRSRRSGTCPGRGDGGERAATRPLFPRVEQVAAHGALRAIARLCRTG